MISPPPVVYADKAEAHDLSFTLIPQTMRTFDWSSYLDVAEYLLRETSEGFMRAACSRA